VILRSPSLVLLSPQAKDLVLLFRTQPVCVLRAHSRVISSEVERSRPDQPLPADACTPASRSPRTRAAG